MILPHIFPIIRFVIRHGIRFKLFLHSLKCGRRTEPALFALRFNALIRAARLGRSFNDLPSGGSLTLAHLLHELVVVATTVGEHLRANGMNFGDNGVFIHWFMPVRKTPWA